MVFFSHDVFSEELYVCFVNKVGFGCLNDAVFPKNIANCDGYIMSVPKEGAQHGSTSQKTTNTKTRLGGQEIGQTK